MQVQPLQSKLDILLHPHHTEVTRGGGSSEAHLLTPLRQGQPHLELDKEHSHGKPVTSVEKGTWVSADWDRMYATVVDRRDISLRSAHREPFSSPCLQCHRLQCRWTDRGVEGMQIKESHRCSHHPRVQFHHSHRHQQAEGKAECSRLIHRKLMAQTQR